MSQEEQTKTPVHKVQELTTYLEKVEKQIGLVRGALLAEEDTCETPLQTAPVMHLQMGVGHKPPSLLKRSDSSAAMDLKDIQVVD